MTEQEKTTYSADGYGSKETTAKKHSDTAARIFVPKSYEGRRVMVILLEKPGK